MHQWCGVYRTVHSAHHLGHLYSACTLLYTWLQLNKWAGRDAGQTEDDRVPGDQDLVARVSPGECALLLSYSPTLHIPLVTESDNLLQELTSDQVRS